MATTAALITIGDELLAGDIDNTNASWLARQLTDRGVDVREIRVVADDVGAIAEAVGELRRRHTIVITTGGLGSTPDDCTLKGVAQALDRPLEANPVARQHVDDAVAEIHERHPDFRHDSDGASRLPRGATVIDNEAGIVPGCRCDNVYVLPGIPEEMRAVFETVADSFTGTIRSRTFHSEIPESHLSPVLADLRSRFDVRVGCYPSGGRKRIRLAGDDESTLAGAAAWLADQSGIEPGDGE